MPSMTPIAATLIGLILSLVAAAGRAEVVAIVSASSPISALTKNEISDIFLGKAARFPDGRPVVPIDQAEASTVREVFYKQYTDRSPAQIKAYWSKIIFTGRGKPPKAVANDNEARTLVAANPHAIGYIERTSVDARVKVLLTQ